MKIHCRLLGFIVIRFKYLTSVFLEELWHSFSVVGSLSSDDTSDLTYHSPVQVLRICVVRGSDGFHYTV